MKVPPKRKGNFGLHSVLESCYSLNESPSEKEGKCPGDQSTAAQNRPLNESPSEKEGKFEVSCVLSAVFEPSMKVPPKRKGNILTTTDTAAGILPLNESPSEKEGKFCAACSVARTPFIPQ